MGQSEMRHTKMADTKAILVQKSQVLISFLEPDFLDQDRLGICHFSVQHSAIFSEGLFKSTNLHWYKGGFDEFEVRN